MEALQKKDQTSADLAPPPIIMSSSTVGCLSLIVIELHVGLVELKAEPRRSRRKEGFQCPATLYCVILVQLYKIRHKCLKNEFVQLNDRQRMDHGKLRIVKMKTNLLHRKDAAPAPHLDVSRKRHDLCPHEAGRPPATRSWCRRHQPVLPGNQDLRSSGPDLRAPTSVFKMRRDWLGVGT